MDRLVYLAAAAARNAELRQENVASNLANANTNGFRAQMLSFRSAAVEGPGLPVRAYAVESSTGADFSPGVLQPTGRQADLAIDGAGWFAVRDKNGREAYTRDGRLHVNQAGSVVNGRGDAIVSATGAPLTVPPDSQIDVGIDGTISALPLNGARNTPVIVGKVKVANPPQASLVRGDDGLFRRADGRPTPDDPNVKVVSGHAEASNVNPVESMVQMISAQRMYDLQLKMISSAEANARAANSLYSSGQ